MTHAVKFFTNNAALCRLAATYLTGVGLVGACFLLMQLAVEIESLARLRSFIP